MTGTPFAPTNRALVSGLAGSCHPVPSLAVTTVAVLLAIGVGHGVGGVLLIGAAVLTGQLSVGWSNDWVDSARDRATGRTAKPAATGRVPVPVVAAAAGLALAATIALSALLGVYAATALLVGVAAGWAYNLGLKATAWSGAPYLLAFGALPLGPYLALPGHPWPPWWVPVVGALLGFGAHFANVLPDLRADAATGVRGLPQRLGPRWGVVVMAVALASASVVLAFGPAGTSRVFALVAVTGGVAGALGAVVAALRAPDGPAAFRITIAIAVLDVGLLIAATT
ncbi:UbiA family prenyltransferase [Umezawaea endophytica]|uniref:UbiA family prenyltransferase n=1 Tax=Umezawaea endophytica TaxID=1654476 RepID=A0A9X2VFU7_9PSEU|nr:UbiA family prenyltransferase [Umezawaea endophytica]MCS7475893.1 UbiA family prenyltransferase [Umezawaea endophytica]